VIFILNEAENLFTKKTEEKIFKEKEKRENSVLLKTR
jgi:hypothetical protein